MCKIRDIALRMGGKPWLAWLSGLSASLRNKGSLVQFPARAHAWVVGQVRSPVGDE